MNNKLQNKYLGLWLSIFLFGGLVTSLIIKPLDKKLIVKNTIIATQEKIILNLRNELKRCKSDLAITDITVTMYQPLKSQTDGTPHILADGTKINVWRASELRYVALSRDLLKRWGGYFKFGDYIYLKNAGIDSGVYQIKDTMHPRFIKRVDILRSRGNQRQIKYNNVKIIKVNIG